MDGAASDTTWACAPQLIERRRALRWRRQRAPVEAQSTDIDPRRVKKRGILPLAHVAFGCASSLLTIETRSPMGRLLPFYYFVVTSKTTAYGRSNGVRPPQKGVFQRMSDPQNPSDYPLP